MNKFLKPVIFTLTALFLIFITSEIAVRLYQKKAFHIPFTQSIANFYDSIFGWEGKKIFGSPQSPRIKLMVVGDSYTDGAGADETKMYYRVVAKALNTELFVYGGPGYGTLQEYLVIDKYIDEIKPDIILLQVCSNDFVNNSFELEKNSYSNNNLLVRPYLINGQIKYYYPRSFGKYRVFLSSYSRLLYMFFNGYDILLAGLAKKGIIKTSDDEITKEGLNFKPFARSKETTLEIMKKIKARAAGIPIIAVPVSAEKPYSDQFKDIFSQINIPYITTPAEKMDNLSAQGINFSIKGHGHWNTEGHQIFGVSLLEEIQKLNLLPKP